MKIALMCSHYYPEEGGIQTHIEGLSTYLAKYGHRIFIITNNTHNKEPIEKVSSKITIFRFRPMIKIQKASFSFEMLKFIMREDFDLIHIHAMFHFGFEISLIKAKLWKIPIIVTLHNFRGNLSRLAFFYDEFIFIKGLRYCNDVITTTKAYFSILMNETGIKSVIIPMAVSEALLNKKNGFSVLYTEYILFVGSLTKDHRFKGVDRIIKILSDLILKYPSLKFIIVGSGDYQEDLKKLSEEYEVQENVIFLGHVKNDDLYNLYKNAIGTILPSTHAETFGMVLIESLACSTPVVASNLPGIQEVVKDYGILVKPNDLMNLKQGIIELINDNKLLRKKNSKNYVLQNYSWQSIIKHILSVYYRNVKTNATS